MEMAKCKEEAHYNPFLQNVQQTKPGCSALTRSDLGVSLKSKEPRESTGDELLLPSTSLSMSAGSSKMLSLCDYTSTSSSEDSVKSKWESYLFV